MTVDVAGYELTVEDAYAIEVWVAVSLPGIRDSDAAYWIGSGYVIERYRDMLAERLANGERVKSWDELEADRADARA